MIEDEFEQEDEDESRTRNPDRLKAELRTQHPDRLKAELRTRNPDHPLSKSMFDPNLPIENTEIDAVQMRGQLTGLKDLIDAVQSVTAVQVDGVDTLNPGDAANVSLSVIGSVLHFSFGIPRGFDGQPGPPFAQAVVDGVTTLNPGDNATSTNSNGVSTLNNGYVDPDMEELRQKMNELINVLRR